MTGLERSCSGIAAAGSVAESTATTVRLLGAKIDRIEHDPLTESRVEIQSPHEIGSLLDRANDEWKPLLTTLAFTALRNRRSIVAPVGRTAAG